ncbi:MAG: ferrochelatase, partial [Neisseriaceae bacterium]|nr:ferrochelatase [Neisseriaceae bacterium]
LEPSTQTLLDTLPEQGITTLDVFCPGFVADCLETLEEIAITGKQQFLDAGGKQFHYIPCLNANSEWINALAELILTNIQDWLPSKDAA